uniref:Uncharacterized protein n=1 Tax=Physcomitrium patens TaxID=3218 RepID=A0A2K1L9N6_PHYPA|nr:hypothetical protein PHYPA_001145 [Physcomitrium patens]
MYVYLCVGARCNQENEEVVGKKSLLADESPSFCGFHRPLYRLQPERYSPIWT